VTLEHVADCEDGAAEIAEHDHAGTLIGCPNGGAHAILVGPKLAVREAPGGLDSHLWARHLRGEGRETLREFRAVRYDYDPDHVTLLLRPSPS
jgi:hypothetical protein